MIVCASAGWALTKMSRSPRVSLPLRSDPA